jgi:hypothetical protein
VIDSDRTWYHHNAFSNLGIDSSPIGKASNVEAGMVVQLVVEKVAMKPQAL